MERSLLEPVAKKARSKFLLPIDDTASLSWDEAKDFE